MSGGSTEYVMGVMKDINGNLMSGYTIYGNSGFNGILYDGSNFISGINFPSNKYYDIYNYYNNRFGYFGRILGDATGEIGSFYSSVSSWYNDDSWFVDSLYSWFVRGAVLSYGTRAGIFAFASFTGNFASTLTFRIVFAI